MKSEKAKEYIDKEILRMDNERLKDCYGYNEERDGISYLEIDEVREAVELAEQEVEERVRQKAIKAFRHFVMEYHCKEASCPKREKCDSSCVISQYFIQKLTEE